MALTEKYVSTTGGGAHDGSSEANAFTWAEMITDINAGSKAGNRYNVKADATYSRTTTIDSLTAGGTSTSPVIIRGYASTIGDGYLGRTNGNGPLVVTNMPSISYSTGAFSVSASFIVIESLFVTGSRNGSTFSMAAADIVAHWCYTLNAAAGANGVCSAVTNRAFIIDCDFVLGNGGNAGLAAISVSSVPRIIGCRISSTAIGISSSGIGLVVSSNTIYDCATIGISLTGVNAYTIISCNTITACGGDGIDIVTGTAVTHIIANNIITDNGGYGIDFNSAAVASVLANNRYRDNTSGNINLGTDWVTATNWGAVTTDTGGPETDYVDAASDNYNLIAASPAVNAGLPLNAAIGALQRDQSGGGGATETSAAYIG